MRFVLPALLVLGATACPPNRVATDAPPASGNTADGGETAPAPGGEETQSRSLRSVPADEDEAFAALYPEASATRSILYDHRTATWVPTSPQRRDEYPHATQHLVLQRTELRRGPLGTMALVVWEDLRNAHGGSLDVVLWTGDGRLHRLERLVDPERCNIRREVSLEPSAYVLAPGVLAFAVRSRCSAEWKMGCYDTEKVELFAREGEALRSVGVLQTYACNRAQDPDEAYPVCSPRCPPGRAVHAAIEPLSTPDCTGLLQRNEATVEIARHCFRDGELVGIDPDLFRNQPR